MKFEQKQQCIVELQVREELGQGEMTVGEWIEVCSTYGIAFKDVFSRNTKYTIEEVVDGKKSRECSVYTISNGNAFDCPALHRGACNVACYGLKGCYRWDSAKFNKEFQRLVLAFAPINWLFEAIKYLATNTNCKEGNKLRFVRLNEVSDLTEELLQKVITLCKLLESNKETAHIVVFTYTKQGGAIDFTEAGKQSNLVINTSQTVNPVYEGGNVYIAVDKEYFDSIVESDKVKKCNCEINCTDCGLCYEDGGYIIFCLIH